MGRLQYNTILGGSHTNDNWMNDTDIISKMYNNDTPNSVDSNSLFTVHHIQSNGKLDIHENISLTTPLQEYLDLSNDSNLVYLYQPSHLYSSLKLEQNLEEQGINTELLNECCPNESIIIGETPAEGSSNIKSFGFVINARPTATCCRCPPDNSPAS